MKDRFSFATLLGRSAPTGISRALGAVTVNASADKIHIGEVVGGPVLLEIARKDDQSGGR